MVSDETLKGFLLSAYQYWLWGAATNLIKPSPIPGINSYETFSQETPEGRLTITNYVGGVYSTVGTYWVHQESTPILQIANHGAFSEYITDERVAEINSLIVEALSTDPNSRIPPEPGITGIIRYDKGDLTYLAQGFGNVWNMDWVEVVVFADQSKSFTLDLLEDRERYLSFRQFGFDLLGRDNNWLLYYNFINHHRIR